MSLHVGIGTFPGQLPVGDPATVADVHADMPRLAGAAEDAT
jgi:hypothetical protein